ncbi:MAG: septal ring lytic transglycosylase RlpA family protein [Coxiellaceae bacterium]|nr:septal ring lytic transglycosylase RlpA family protein [Coxiellaceae bacterium]
MVTRIIRTGSIATIIALLTGCASVSVPQDGAPARPRDVSHIPNAKPKKLPLSRYGNPKSYVVFGKRYYVLDTAKGYNQRGIASWYGTKFHGQLTSSREPYDMYGMTAASPVLPIPTFVKVTNMENGHTVIVKVNDRGPFAPNRIIDLSYAAAKKLGYMRKGTAIVQVTALSPGEHHHPMLADTEFQPVSHNPHLYLQLGAFSNFSNATNLQRRIKHLTQRTVRLKTVKAGHTPIYKVQVGPLAGVGETDKLKQQLEDSGYGEAMTVVS